MLNRIKKELGFERIEKLYFGAAPLSNKVKKFFASLNMPLINTYGLSETSAATTDMPTANINISKAGKPYPGT